MKESAIYIIYKWLWHEVDSGVDHYLPAGGQGVDTSMDHVWTVFQHLCLKSYKVSSVYRFTEVLKSPSLTMSHIPAGWYQIHSTSFPSSIVNLFEFQATGPIIGFSKKSPIATNQIMSSFPPSFQ